MHHDVVAGEVTGTVSMAGRSGLWQVNDEPVHTFVIEADRVDHVAIVRPGPSVAVVPASTLASRQIETLDSTRRVFAVEIPDDLATAPIASKALDDVVARATVAVAAELVGVGRWLLDHSITYAKEREQFGQPIGSFQGLQWKLVAMALDQELVPRSDRGFVLVRISKVIEADPKQAQGGNRAAALLGAAQYDAYVASLREQADIDINLENLEKR